MGAKFNLRKTARIDSLEAQLAEKTAQWIHQKASAHKARKQLWERKKEGTHRTISIAGLRSSNRSLASRNSRLQEEIRALEEELGNKPVAKEETYRRGDRFLLEWKYIPEEEYILTQKESMSAEYVLVGLEDGCHATKPFKPEDQDNITLAEVTTGLSITNITPIRKEAE
jgi:chromosome segregation ATPase